MALRDLMQLARAPAMFTALADILAVHLIVTGGSVDGRALGLTLLASAGLYLGGMVLNDCFDLEEDRRERPGRPLPAGRVSLRFAWAGGFGLLALGALSAAAAGRLPGLVALVLVITIIAYNGWLKRGIGGVFAMAACRYLNWLLGAAALPWATTSLALGIPSLFYVGALTYLSRVETTAASVGALYGCMMGLVLSAAALGALVLTGVLEQAWVMLPATAGLAYLLYRLARLRSEFVPERIGATVSMLIFGIVPLDALMAAGGAPWWGALAVLALLLPGRLLSRAIYVT